MQAVKFETRIENGVISIPYQYKNTFSDNIRVILLTEEGISLKPVKQKKKELHYIGIDMTGYKFDREEANERR